MTPEENNAIIQKVKQAIGRQQAINLYQLASILSVKKSHLKKAIGKLLQNEEVEMLRPIGITTERHIFYRVNDDAKTIERRCHL